MELSTSLSRSDYLVKQYKATALFYNVELSVKHVSDEEVFEMGPGSGLKSCALTIPSGKVVIGEFKNLFLSSAIINSA